MRLNLLDIGIDLLCDDMLDGNKRLVSSLVGVLIRCSFYAEAAPAGMSRRPLVLGLARLFHRVLGEPVEGVNFKRGRSSGRRRIRIVAPVEPVSTSGLRARGEQTRQKLLDAGAEILPKRGYHDARVDDIVEAAGVSHGPIGAPSSKHFWPIQS